eukprot:92404-Ditylum_brightwellii.AAC.1
MYLQQQWQVYWHCLPGDAAESWSEGCANYIAQPPGKFDVRATASNCCQYSTYNNKWDGYWTLGTSPGAMVFQRDMLINLPVVADL